jgi:preprotein translocase subunit SecE
MSEVITYIKESFEELKNNVSWTPRSELQRLTMVVLIFSLIFSLAIWGADTVLSRLITIYFKLINGWSW